MKKRYCLAILVLFFALSILTVYADESAALLESRVSDQSIVLYMRNTGSTAIQARIAFEDVTDITVDGKDGTLPITTWLLLDNSISIDQSDRARAKELLIDLVSSRSSNETFTLCTFADHLNPIISESQDYSELKQAIENIQHYDQETYLTDCLDELLALETARTDARYVRIVVISDGVDNNPGGITRDELVKELEKNNFPIYSIGCAGNAQELKEMYAISRQTGAKYWALNEVENYDITRAMSSEEIPTRATILIPASLCDGTTKGVQVTFDDGTSLETQVDMPFGENTITPAPVPTPEPTPEPEPIPTPPPKQESEPTAADWMRAHWLLIVVLAFVIVVLAVGGYLFLHRETPPKKTKDENVPTQGKKVDPPHGSIFLGREKSNDITINDSKISKRHCAIFVSGDNIIVYDLDSLNGTLVDDVKIEKGGCRQARSGSTLTLANVKFEMEICDAAPESAVTPNSVATIYFNSEDIGHMASSERTLCITDISRRDRCYKVPLPDIPARNVQSDETVFMG